jgi:hypothetical protein
MTKKINNFVPEISELQDILDRLFDKTKDDEIEPKSRKAVSRDVRGAVIRLEQLLHELDPIRQPTSVFDPSNPKIVGRFVSLALVAQPRQPLSSITRFYGSGVYAIYYNGEFGYYSSLSRSETPIYVGQASPTISNAKTPMEQGEKLSKRLQEHKKNILRANSTLSIDDFEFRTLVVQSGWETAAEDYLIHLFHPIWNNQTGLVYGLGKHGDDAKTRANKRSPWDIIHPGREWAATNILQDAKSSDRIAEELKDHFEKYPVFTNLNDLLRSFVEELKQI